MYREAAGLGAYAILNYAWDQPDSVTVAAQMIHFARGFGLSRDLWLFSSSAAGMIKAYTASVYRTGFGICWKNGSRAARSAQRRK